ncbi:RNA polymerase sigma factor (sigma-70 family) [Saccharothrix ecbatanensis]|uniref:RNA polymerase sigma factor (Sigma-70 family) n=1 Tax=Saccharothrix ecbatanensis TaxID=1105145 RepID=A0A7W9M593_9PSEU|nr:sigma-70 family RNA polymerase sigma factor [Saccharothrix ecbatanensis]MBB5807941.1 RNA polymerase sigma factor (sigma-70 family) [Saccharothrix ecbatanensis]
MTSSGPATFGGPVEHLLRTLTPQVLGILVRRYRDFSRCEDAVQEALIDAAATWSRDGVPEHPLGWLTTVAARRYVDQVRSDAARERREQALFDAVPRDQLLAPPPDAEPVRDDLLELLFLCCHPALTPSAQMALTLRAVAGLTTTEIATAFLVPDKTMGQRISRAKQRLREVGARFEPPPDHKALGTVLHVLYLLFNEGYSASAGPTLRRPDLTEQAMRLTQELHRRLPDAGETAGLLALMLLTEARAATRTGPDGILVPLAEQDRSKWDRAAIAEGADLVTRSLADHAVGPYQVQAAIAAVHCEAITAEDTDWPQILALYDVLERLAPSPVAALNRAVAVGEVHGPRAALEAVAELEQGVLAGNHRLFAVRAHLLEQAGDLKEASEAFRQAARLAGNVPEQRFLLLRAARCASTG